MQINNSLSNYNSINYSGKNQVQISMQTSLNDFVNASDEDLYYIAKSENKRKHKNDVSKFIGTCIGVDALSNMILKSHVQKNVNGEIKIVKAPLSAKIGAGLKSVKGWAVGFAAVGALVGVKNAVLRKNEKFNEFEANHPVGSFLAEIGALALGYQGAKSVGNKLSIGTKISKKTAPLTKVVSKLGAKIDKSKLSTFIMNRGSDFSNFINSKAPALGMTGRLLLSNSVLIMLMAGMLKINRNDKEVQKTFEDLKFAQNQIRENFY